MSVKPGTSGDGVLPMAPPLSPPAPPLAWLTCPFLRSSFLPSMTYSDQLAAPSLIASPARGPLFSSLAACCVSPKSPTVVLAPPRIIAPFPHHPPWFTILSATSRFISFIFSTSHFAHNRVCPVLPIVLLSSRSLACPSSSLVISVLVSTARM